MATSNLTRKLSHRLESKIERITESGCWIWMGTVQANGYGRSWDPKIQQSTVAHRVVYEEARGPIPNGMTLDHLCRVKCCVNPDHLDVVSQRVNTLRGTSPAARQAKQTHCKRGHQLAGENLYLRPSDPRQRQCRICRDAATVSSRRKRTLKGTF